MHKPTIKIGTITSKGQLTIPAHMREKLRLSAGTKVSFRELEDGSIAIKPKTGDIRELYGIIKYKGPPVSIEDMDAGIRAAVVKRYKRSLS